MARLERASMEIEEVHDPHDAVDFMVLHAKKYAAAKALRIYTEEFRKSKKAILFARATGNTIADRENYAYAHPEYREVLKGLQEAVERAEALKWELVAAQARIDVWRSQEASKDRKSTRLNSSHRT